MRVLTTTTNHKHFLNSLHVPPGKWKGQGGKEGWGVGNIGPTLGICPPPLLLPHILTSHTFSTVSTAYCIHRRWQGARGHKWSTRTGHFTISFCQCKMSEYFFSLISFLSILPCQCSSSRAASPYRTAESCSTPTAFWKKYITTHIALSKWMLNKRDDLYSSYYFLGKIHR